jgi:hypothetical protein
MSRDLTIPSVVDRLHTGQHILRLRKLVGVADCPGGRPCPDGRGASAWYRRLVSCCSWTHHPRGDSPTSTRFSIVSRSDPPSAKYAVDQPR